MAPPITTLMFYVVETTNIELLIEGTETETALLLQLWDQGEGKNLEVIGRVFRNAAAIPRNQPTRYVRVPAGIYWISSINTLKYSIDANACRVHSKADKDPWPPPPPPPHKPSLALLGNYKAQFDQVVGPGGGSQDHTWSAVTATRVATPQFVDIQPLPDEIKP
jgi:hypothetical protein